MVKLSRTVQAAWIAVGATIFATVIGVITTYKVKDHSKPEEIRKAESKAPVITQGPIGKDGPSVNKAGVPAGGDAATTINVNPRGSVDPDYGKLFVDKVDILRPEETSSQLSLSFDVTLRNPGSSR